MRAEPETVAVRAWLALAAMPSTRAIGKCAGVSHVTVLTALDGPARGLAYPGSYFREGALRQETSDSCPAGRDSTLLCRAGAIQHPWELR